MDKFNAIKIFHHVVEKGSYAGVAQSLGISPSTISKAISRLETNLNVQLIHRDSRKLHLTSAGRHYWQTSLNLLQQLEDTEQELSLGLSQPSGTVKINAPVSYGRLYIVPLLNKFAQLHPQINIDISFNDAYVDLISEGFDLGIRSGTLQDSQLVAQQLSPVDLLICASTEYARSIKTAITEKQFAQHRWIQFRYRQSGKLLDLIGRNGSYQPKAAAIVDDGEAMAELCAQGLGLCQIPHFIARKYINSSQLKVVAKPYRPAKHGVWLIYPKQQQVASKTRLFIDFLKQEVSALGDTPRHTWVQKIPQNSALL